MSIKSIVIVSSSTLASRVFGLLRDSIIFAYLGTSPLNAAFLMAFTLPNLFRRLLGEGALTSALMPVLAQVIEKEGIKKSNDFLNTVLTRLCLLLIGLCVIGILLLKAVTFIPDLPDRWYAGAIMGQWLMLYMPMICLAAILSAALNLYGHFAITALAPISLNFSMVLCLVVGAYFSQSAWNLIIALSIGVLIGGLIQWLLPMVQLLKTGWRPQWKWEKNSHFQEVITLFLPGLGGAAIFQINLLLSRLFAFSLDDSSISLLYLGSRLVELPMGVFTLAIVTVIFPQMSRLAAQNNPYIKTIYAQGMRLVLAITIPGAVGLIILAHPIISTLFQWGVFVKSDVLAAIPILSIYSLSIPLYSWATLSTRAFHALKDTKTPMRLAGVSLLINTSLSFILMHYWGVKGLAWASLIAISVQSIYLHVSLMRKSALFHHLGVLKAFLKIMAAAISMGGVVWMIYSIFFQQDMDNKYYQIISLCLLIPFAVIFYGFLLVILGFEDLKALKALCYRVLDSKKATNPTAIE